MVLCGETMLLLAELFNLGPEFKNLMVIINNLIIYLPLILFAHSFDQRLEISLLFLLILLAFFQQLLELMILKDLFINDSSELVSFSSCLEKK